MSSHGVKYKELKRFTKKFHLTESIHYLIEINKHYFFVVDIDKSVNNERNIDAYIKGATEAISHHKTFPAGAVAYYLTYIASFVVVVSCDVEIQ